jgi:hypothetical protein
MPPVPAEIGCAGTTSNPRLQTKTTKKNKEKMNLIMILPPFQLEIPNSLQKDLR